MTLNEEVAIAIAEAHEEEWYRLTQETRDVYRGEAAAAIAVVLKHVASLIGGIDGGVEALRDFVQFR